MQHHETTARTQLSEQVGVPTSPLTQIKREEYIAKVAQLRSALERRAASSTLRHNKRIANDESRRIHYLSMEFLLGRCLRNALDAMDASRGAQDDAWLEEIDVEPGLGNGGLGRLAACFLDSLAELDLPAYGYGLRYSYGMFTQNIVNGVQQEEADSWLAQGFPWESQRAEATYLVGFGGSTTGDEHHRTWVPANSVLATAFDVLIPGHSNDNVATLRLWSATSLNTIDLRAFNRGDYAIAAERRIADESLTWVLYPDDTTDAGRTLRLKQEYLLVSASMQDMIKRHLQANDSLSNFAVQNVLHLNDTHPALAPVELLRLLTDEHGLAWDEAWGIVAAATSYTNHTLLPEALETWPVSVFEQLLPRHLELIYRINHEFLQQVRGLRFVTDEYVRNVSLIDENHGRRVRMAGLAVICSAHVNGVAKLHSQLMQRTTFADYAKLYPQRFTNVTNGVTPRRWLSQANPELSRIIDRLVPEWRGRSDRLQDLRFFDAKPLWDELNAVKRRNKERLATAIRAWTNHTMDPARMCDVQVKRIHEYKRQLLNVFHVIARYQAICDSTTPNAEPRTIIIAGKAAPGYRRAKEIVQLIHDVANVVNRDPRSRDLLTLIFVPNYNVSKAELIIPAADLSEQISTAGTEASGTGNMKLAMNGALTIGTWDGANIEIAEAVGSRNFFAFGNTHDQLDEIRRTRKDSRDTVANCRQLQYVVDAIRSGQFSPNERCRYHELIDDLLRNDTFHLFDDFPDYLRAQKEADLRYSASDDWASAALHNIAAMGDFTSDRAIRHYCERVWHISVASGPGQLNG